MVGDTGPIPDSFDSFPVVGIGASAGGLEAISRLFAPLTADCGMAFLVVQHLAAGRTSLLADLLGKKTSLPVTEAVDGQPVEKNRVYVIPPTTSMTLRQGLVCLEARDDRTGPPSPIDDLFFSLARDKGASAVAVVLSGNGADGAAGARAVKGEGGVIMAQDAHSAQFKSMPEAAAHQGAMDFTGSPEDIAARLISLAAHPYLKSGLAEEQIDGLECDADALKRLFGLLRSHCNLDFSHYKRSVAIRRIVRRMGLLNLTTLSELAAFLESSPAEVKRLCEDMLIPVTSFFRDPEVFEGLRDSVFPALLEDLPGHKPLRIWVAGCSTGEEVYSIAICLFECLDSRGIEMPVQIFGTDVSDAALATARRGVYLENVVRDVSADRLARFFKKTKSGYQVAKRIREVCVFARHNSAADPPFSHISLVSCRNLLIYFDGMLQRQVLLFFHYALRHGGFLLLGPSESIGKSDGLFNQAFAHESNVFRRAATRPRSYLEYILPGNRTKKAVPASNGQPLEPARFDVEKQKAEVDFIIQTRYVPAGVICDGRLNIVEFRGDTSPYLKQAPGPASTNLQQLARPGLMVEVRRLMEKARKNGLTETSRAPHVQTSSGTRAVRLEVVPVLPNQAESAPWYLVLFREDSLPKAPPFAKLRNVRRILRERLSFRSGKGREIEQLKQELSATREHLRVISSEYDSTVEQLKISQEELLSSNEEFQSTNEELETAKEELQSANEELITTNDELRHRNIELNLLNGQLKFAGDYANVIIDTMRDPLLVLDGELRVVRANMAFLNLCGLSAAQVESSFFYELGNGQWNVPELRMLMRKLLLKDSSVQNQQVAVKLPSQENREFLVGGTLLAWNDQSLLLLSFEDVTKFRSDARILQESVQRRDEFLAMLAHELRNPLEPIRAAMEIWRRGDAGSEEEKDAQEILDRQIRKLVRLVDDLLDVGRITRNSIVLEKTPVNLNQAVGQAVEGIRYLYQIRRHHLEVHLPNEPVIVEGDAIRMEQIISNLLSNSAKYTEPGGRVDITLGRESQEAVVRVVDNGIGIEAEFLPRVFEMFVQAKAGLDRAQGGLGVGLSLVRRLVVEQGGAIQAESEGLQRGSCFTLRFPLIAPPISYGAEAGGVYAPLASIGKHRILLVDDNVDSLRATGMLLKLEGHEVQTAQDGPAALEIAREFRPEIVILDIGLPGMDGFQLGAALRRLASASETLILALSGYGTEADREKSRQAGIDQHFVKPLDMEKLKSVIHSHEFAVPAS